MIKTRFNVFETNSSSTHSLSMGNSSEGLTDTLYVNSIGEVTIYGNVFGWAAETYNGAPDKASYLALYARDWAEGRSEEFKNILVQVIKEHTKCDRVVFDLDSSYSAIDHASVEGRALHYIFEDPEIIKNFLFNRSSVLETGNDND